MIVSINNNTVIFVQYLHITNQSKADFRAGGTSFPDVFYTNIIFGKDKISAGFHFFLMNFAIIQYNPFKYQV